MQFVTGGLDLLLIVIHQVCYRTGRTKYITRTVLPYFVYHSVAIVCVYKKWVPASFDGYPNLYVDDMILLSFILVNSVPLIDFKQTIFGMLPVLILSETLMNQVGA